MPDLLFLALFFAILLVPCVVAAHSIRRGELEWEDAAPAGLPVSNPAPALTIFGTAPATVRDDQEFVGDFGALQEAYSREEERVLALCRSIEKVA
jgi:hypothetical protein